jgi:hypothetical protein
MMVVVKYSHEPLELSTQTASFSEFVVQAWLALQQSWSFHPQGFEHRFSSGFSLKANGEAVAIGIR